MAAYAVPLGAAGGGPACGLPLALPAVPPHAGLAWEQVPGGMPMTAQMPVLPCPMPIVNFGMPPLLQPPLQHIPAGPLLPERVEAYAGLAQQVGVLQGEVRQLTAALHTVAGCVVSHNRSGMDMQEMQELPWRTGWLGSGNRHGQGYSSPYINHIKTTAVIERSLKKQLPGTIRREGNATPSRLTSPDRTAGDSAALPGHSTPDGPPPGTVPLPPWRDPGEPLDAFSPVPGWQAAAVEAARSEAEMEVKAKDQQRLRDLNAEADNLKALLDAVSRLGEAPSESLAAEAKVSDWEPTLSLQRGLAAAAVESHLSPAHSHSSSQISSFAEAPHHDELQQRSPRGGASRTAKHRSPSTPDRCYVFAGPGSDHDDLRRLCLQTTSAAQPPCLARVDSRTALRSCSSPPQVPSRASVCRSPETTDRRVRPPPLLLQPEEQRSLSPAAEPAVVTRSSVGERISIGFPTSYPDLAPAPLSASSRSTATVAEAASAAVSPKAAAAAGGPTPTAGTAQKLGGRKRKLYRKPADDATQASLPPPEPVKRGGRKRIPKQQLQQPAAGPPQDSEADRNDSLNGVGARGLQVRNSYGAQPWLDADLGESAAGTAGKVASLDAQRSQSAPSKGREAAVQLHEVSSDAGNAAPWYDAHVRQGAGSIDRAPDPSGTIVRHTHPCHRASALGHGTATQFAQAGDPYNDHQRQDACSSLAYDAAPVQETHHRHSRRHRSSTHGAGPAAELPMQHESAHPSHSGHHRSSESLHDVHRHHRSSESLQDVHRHQHRGHRSSAHGTAPLQDVPLTNGGGHRSSAAELEAGHPSLHGHHRHAAHDADAHPSLGQTHGHHHHHRRHADHSQRSAHATVDAEYEAHAHQRKHRHHSPSPVQLSSACSSPPIQPGATPTDLHAENEATEPPRRRSQRRKPSAATASEVERSTQPFSTVDPPTFTNDNHDMMTLSPAALNNRLTAGRLPPAAHLLATSQYSLPTSQDTTQSPAPDHRPPMRPPRSSRRPDPRDGGSLEHGQDQAPPTSLQVGEQGAGVDAAPSSYRNLRKGLLVAPAQPRPKHRIRKGLALDNTQMSDKQQLDASAAQSQEHSESRRSSTRHTRHSHRRGSHSSHQSGGRSSRRSSSHLQGSSHHRRHSNEAMGHRQSHHSNVAGADDPRQHDYFQQVIGQLAMQHPGAREQRRPPARSHHDDGGSKEDRSEDDVFYD